MDVIKPQRKLIVNTAQGWYESAYDDSQNYSMSERLLFMENALNHTENALFASNQKLEQQNQQIHAMRNCVSCKIFESCKAIAPLPGCLEDGYKNWEWDGGSGE